MGHLASTYTCKLMMLYLRLSDLKTTLGRFLREVFALSEKSLKQLKKKIGLKVFLVPRQHGRKKTRY